MSLAECGAGNQGPAQGVPCLAAAQHLASPPYYSRAATAAAPLPHTAAAATPPSWLPPYPPLPAYTCRQRGPNDTLLRDVNRDRLMGLLTERCGWAGRDAAGGWLLGGWA